jgi:hypothetical protein
VVGVHLIAYPKNFSTLCLIAIYLCPAKFITSIMVP